MLFAASSIHLYTIIYVYIYIYSLVSFLIYFEIGMTLQT